MAKSGYSAVPNNILQLRIHPVSNPRLHCSLSRFPEPRRLSSDTRYYHLTAMHNYNYTEMLYAGLFGTKWTFLLFATARQGKY